MITEGPASERWSTCFVTSPNLRLERAGGDVERPHPTASRRPLSRALAAKSTMNSSPIINQRGASDTVVAALLLGALLLAVIALLTIPRWLTREAPVGSKHLQAELRLKTTSRPEVVLRNIGASKTTNLAFEIECWRRSLAGRGEL